MEEFVERLVRRAMRPRTAFEVKSLIEYIYTEVVLRKAWKETSKVAVEKLVKELLNQGNTNEGI
jgi:hypothetical protein